MVAAVAHTGHSEVRFDRLRVRYGLLWRKLELPLRKQGITLIFGENGSGKTSISELLCDAFYGKTVKSGSGNAIINRHARSEDKGMTLEVLFARREMDKWVKYKLVKHQGVKGKRNGVTIWRQGQKESITPARDARAAKKMAAEVLGLTFEEFIAGVCLPTRSVHPLVSGTPSQRAKYVTDVYGLAEYDELLAKAKAERAKLRATLEDYADDTERLSVLERDLKELPPAKRFKSAIRSLSHDIERMEAEEDRLEELIRRAIRKRDKQRRRQKLVKKGVPDKGSRSAASVRKDLKKYRARQDALRDTLPDMRERKSTEKRLKDTKARLPKKAPRGSLKEIKKAMAALNKEHGRLEERIETLEALSGRTKCPTCEQSLRGDHAPKKRIKALRKELADTEDRHDQHQQHSAEWSAYNELQEDIRELQETLRDLPKGDYDKVYTKVRELDTTVEQAERLLEKLVRSEALRKELAELPKGSPSKTQKLIDKHETARTKLRKKLNKKREALGKAEEKLERREEVIETVKRLRKADKKTKALRGKEAVLEDLVFAFGNKGMKLDRMREILGEIQARLPAYTAALLPRYTFRLAEKENSVEFDVIEPGGHVAPTATMSTGEQKRLSLALLLAERDLRSVKTNLLFLDEFDGGLDDGGCDMLLEILGDLTDVYPSIFAISHNESVTGHAAFESRLRVERGKHYSSLRTMTR